MPESPHDRGKKGFPPLRFVWRMLRYVVLLLPLGLFFVKLPHGTFTLEALEQAGSDLAAQVDLAAIQYQPGNGRTIIPLDFREVERATYTPALREQLDGRIGRLRGQFIPGRDGRTFGLVRLKMVCCAADVIPLLILVVSEDGVPALPTMSWVEVEGQVQFRRRRDGTGFTPILVVPSRGRIMPIAPEADPYIR